MIRELMSYLFEDCTAICETCGYPIMGAGIPVQVREESGAVFMAEICDACVDILPEQIDEHEIYGDGWFVDYQINELDREGSAW